MVFTTLHWPVKQTLLTVSAILSDNVKGASTLIKQSRMLYSLINKGGFRGVLAALKHPPPKFYNEQARKLLEAVLQVQLHFIHMYGQLKDGKSKGNS